MRKQPLAAGSLLFTMAIASIGLRMHLVFCNTINMSALGIEQVHTVCWLIYLLLTRCWGLSMLLLLLLPSRDFRHLRSPVLAGMTCQQCFWSIFQYHNETGNACGFLTTSPVRLGTVLFRQLSHSPSLWSNSSWPVHFPPFNVVVLTENKPSKKNLNHTSHSIENSAFNRLKCSPLRNPPQPNAWSSSRLTGMHLSRFLGKFPWNKFLDSCWSADYVFVSALVRREYMGAFATCNNNSGEHFYRFARALASCGGRFLGQPHTYPSLFWGLHHIPHAYG